MSRNDAGQHLCAGCGRPSERCGCSPGDVRRALERDRATLSDRAVKLTARSLDEANEVVHLREVERLARLFVAWKCELRDLEVVLKKLDERVPWPNIWHH